VSFVHLSVNQFLLSPHGSAHDQLGPKESHFKVALRSLKYMSLPLDDLPYSVPLMVEIDQDKLDLWDKMVSNYPLISYATSSWAYHLLLSTRAGGLDSDIELSADLESVFPKYQPVAWMEQVGIGTHGSIIETVKSFSLALALRK
jgi:hypothetical protein